jgi:hypothetical protein
VAVLLAAALFEGFAFVTTQVRSLRAHSPWQDDPYDAVVSFTVFFVPLLCALCVVRVQLFRRAQPVGVQRVRDVLRACWVVLAMAGATYAVDWLSVGLGADRSTWTAATPVLIGLLAAATAVLLGSAAALSAASRQPGLSAPGGTRQPVDWAGDVVAVADLWSLRLGPIGEAAAPVRTWLRAGVLQGRWGVRRHPVLWAAAAALAFGLLLALTAAREEGLSPVLPLFAGVGACGCSRSC